MTEIARLDTKEKRKLMGDKQQKRLAIFYKEFFEVEGYHMLYFVGAVFCAVTFTGIMFIPLQEIKENHVQFLLIMWAAYLYSSAYNKCIGDTKDNTIYGKLKNLPISEKQFRLNIIRKWCKKTIIIFVISLIGQLSTTWAFCNEISWINVVYVVNMGLIVPIAISVLSLLTNGNGWFYLALSQLIVAFML